MVDHKQQSDLLTTYCDNLAAGLDTLPDEYLDPQLSATAARLHSNLVVPGPGSDFVVSLEQKLRTEARHIEDRKRADADTGFFSGVLSLLSTLTWRRPALIARLVGIGAIGATLVLVTLLYMRPMSISAKEIVESAREASKAPGTRVQSFVLTGTISTRTEPGSMMLGVTSRIYRWYEHPRNWRVEDVGIEKNPNVELTGGTYLQVSDGSSVWDYEPQGKVASVRPVEPEENGVAALAGLPAVPHGPTPEITGLNSWLSQADNCYTPEVLGQGTVAGRAVHVIDLGPSQCPSNSAPVINGRQVVWIDQETYFVLKGVLHDASGKELSKLEVLDIRYNIPLDESLFSFVPPLGVAVDDHRKVPTPTQVGQAEEPTAVPVPSSSGQSLKQIRNSVDFSVFVPSNVPDQLRPDPPLLRRESGAPDMVQIDYRSAYGKLELTILNGPEGCCLDADPRKAGTTMALPGIGTVHLIKVEPEYGGPILWWVQDGTYISLSAPHLSLEKLTEIATSMSNSGELQ